MLAMLIAMMHKHVVSHTLNCTQRRVCATYMHACIQCIAQHRAYENTDRAVHRTHIGCCFAKCEKRKVVMYR